MRSCAVNVPAQRPLVRSAVRVPPRAAVSHAHAPAPLPTPHSSHHDIEMIKKQLRDAEAERDRCEALLAQHDVANQQLVSRIRLSAMSQAKTKMALQELKTVVLQAKDLSAKEHLQLFADRVHVAGKAFKNETCKKQFMARQQLGMVRLKHYESTLFAMTDALRSAVSSPSSQTGRPGLN